jgi:hypothetical protein
MIWVTLEPTYFGEKKGSVLSELTDFFSDRKLFTRSLITLKQG